jgi:hypothetical protein
MNITIDHPTGRPNFTNVTIGDVELWFSYRTLIGFQTSETAGRIVRENEWGPTTGKHLNYIGTAAPRVSGERFAELVAQHLGTFGLVSK